MIHARARRLAASQEGFALIEVLVSAAVLIVVALGALAAIDSITGTAGANKARTIAATLAEKDQEELRSLRTADLDRFDLVPYTVDVGGVTYTVTPEARWVYDAGGTEASCAIKDGDGRYLRIRSTVTSPMMGSEVKPVVLSSIVAPQVGADNTGSLAVSVINAKGEPVEGVSVTAGSKSGPTNALGCAVLEELPPGAYNVQIAKGGYVDREGISSPTKTANVATGSLSTVEFSYDRAARVTITTRRPGIVDALLGREPALSVVAANDLIQSQRRVFASSNPGITPGVLMDAFPSGTGDTFELTNLFPFLEGYTFYSGGCLNADPSLDVANYFQVAPGNQGKVVLQPGQTGAPITVYEPDINLAVTSGLAGVAATVYAYPTEEGCTGVRIPLGTTKDVTGRLSYSGLPFGSYTICAQRRVSGNWRDKTATINVNRLTGMPATTINMGSGTSSGECGATAP